tara:strand:+ start:472 stop:867 length:396 start_codon:yes stop_codon:yes gene_type:complete
MPSLHEALAALRGPVPYYRNGHRLPDSYAKREHRLMAALGRVARNNPESEEAEELRRALGIVVAPAKVWRNRNAGVAIMAVLRRRGRMPLPELVRRSGFVASTIANWMPKLELRGKIRREMVGHVWWVEAA